MDIEANINVEAPISGPFLAELMCLFLTIMILNKYCLKELFYKIAKISLFSKPEKVGVRFGMIILMCNTSFNSFVLIS